MDIFLQQILNGLLLGSIYALVALGYTMVYGILGLINFAHGDIVMVGALVALSVVMGLGASLPVMVILLLATAAAIAVCVALGLVVERAAYRPLRRAPRLAPLITAIGVSILFQYSAALVWGKQYISLPEIVKPGKSPPRRRSSSCSPAPSWRRCCGSSKPAAWGVRCAPPNKTPMSQGSWAWIPRA